VRDLVRRSLHRPGNWRRRRGHQRRRRGKSLPEKFALYQEDMKRVLTECSRVLRRRKFCTIIVGTNSNQIGKILKRAPNEVEGLDDMLVQMGQETGLSLIRTMQRSIIGMSNTMRREQILLLQKT